MKNKRVCIIVLLILQSLALSAQGLLHNHFSINNVKEGLGIKPADDFALMHDGDTLAYFKTTSEGWRARLFDETMVTKYFNDSLEQRFNSDTYYRITRTSLPDSLTIFEKTRKKTEWLRVVRYDSAGRELWRVDSSAGAVLFAKYSNDGVAITSKKSDGYDISWKSHNRDTIYLASYDPDSVLLRFSWSSNHKPFNRSGSYNKFPFRSDLRESFYTRDSNYNYSHSYWERDTSVRQSYTVKYPEVDSSFSESMDYGSSDSSYRYEIQKGHSMFSVDFDSRYGTAKYRQGPSGIERDYFDLKGNLTHRVYDNEVKRVEWSRTDTFYYQISYYHGLRWERDTGNVLDYFPYSHQLLLDEDSSLIRTVSYHFKPFSWPEISVSEGDSTWLIDQDSSAKSAFRLPLVFCKSPMIANTGFDHQRDSIVITGLVSSEVKERLRVLARSRNFFGEGFYPPPFYLIFSNSAPKGLFGDHLYTSLPIQPRQRKALVKILNEATPSKTILYINGKKRKFKGMIVRIDHSGKTIEFSALHLH